MLGARNKHGRQDLMLSTTDHTRFLKVIKSKVQGTINVVSALSPIKSKLELFVMLSSSCSPHHALLIMLSSSLGIIGNRGQVNYAAASTFLDVFAAQLVTRGYLPGHLYQSGQRAQGRARSRRTSIRTSTASPSLWAGSWPIHYSPRSGPLQAAGQVAEAPVSHGLREATTMEAAVKAVTRAIVHEVARIMALSVQEIDPRWSLGSYGVDSRMTVDFKAWFQREVGMSMGTVELLGELARTQLVQQAADASQFLPAELRGG
ncbi:hypothetical protein CBS147346_8623 [Aspergillus niger]|nr:hypothetical protein CBS147346_8623 [Aspergillus niger]